MSRQAKPENQLTVSEAQEIRGLLGNQVLLSAIRKMLAEEADFWGSQMRAETLKPNPNVQTIVQYAAREAQAKATEKLLWKAVGG